MRREFVGLPIEMPLLWTGIMALAGAIFIADTLTDLEIAVGVLYVAVVLISVRFGRPRAVMLVGTGCSILTILSYFLTPRGAPESGLVNCALSLVAIGATTYLAVKIQSAEARVRQAQADLAHMSRVTTMGELTASIAHEVSQPLAAIVANGNAAIRWLAASPPDQDEARQALDRIIKDAGRAGDVIGRVRRLVTRAPPLRDRVDLIDAIQEVLALTRSEVRRNHVLLRTELANDLPAIFGDRVQLQQVILNFVVNAVEAMSGLETGPRELLVSAATDGKKVTVSVRDSGVGLAPAALDRVFAAFYTTKPTGMGMGLAISRSIVEAHGGAVYAAPNLPRGMVFGFTLPVRAEAKE